MTPTDHKGLIGADFCNRLCFAARIGYAVIHTAVWAFGAAVLLLLVLQWSDAANLSSQAAALSQERASEDRAYCEKWGMAVGTHAHTLCTLDLKQLRADQERHGRAAIAGLF